MSDDITKQIEETLSSSPVILFMKGTPDFPQCGFSAQTDPRLHFGLGLHSGSVSVTVRWYGGETETLQLDANRYHVVRQPR